MTETTHEETMNEIYRRNEEHNAREIAIDEHRFKVWDACRLPVMDLFFEGKITRKQVWAIERVFREAFRKQALVPERAPDVRVDKFAVKMTGRKASVVIRMTCEGFKGTLAGCLCNTYGHFFVGPQGGIEAANYKTGDKGKARKSPLIYGFTN